MKSGSSRGSKATHPLHIRTDSSDMDIIPDHPLPGSTSSLAVDVPINLQVAERRFTTTKDSCWRKRVLGYVDFGGGTTMTTLEPEDLF